jgi:alkylation response protein AidB-like acyl-CoA dehydrogenase
VLVDFGFSEEQEQIRQSARDFLAKECPMTLVRTLMEDDRGHSDALWQQMAALGWMGLVFPEAYGGAGLTDIDLVVVLEEMGRVVMPGPFFATVLLGGVAIREGGSDAQKKALLPAIAAGKLKTTLALLEPSARWDAAGVQCEARREGGGYRLSGTKLFVNDALVADKIVCAARLAGTGGGADAAAGVTLFILDAGTPGLGVIPLKTMDQTRKLAEVTLADVRVGADALLGPPGEGWPIIERVMDRGKVGLCAEMCGGAQRVLDMSVEYAKVREQFGRPIGSFQAIQHKCANMLVEVESAKSATYYAAWAVANDVAEAPLAAAMAKAYCSDAYRHTAGEGIQVHGGIGFTWEHDMHLYFKRAKSSEVTFGDATWNRELVARLIDL